MTSFNIQSGKVGVVLDIIETLIDIYTDTFYMVKDDYVEKLQKIRSEGKFEEFSDLESLKRSREED